MKRVVCMIVLLCLLLAVGCAVKAEPDAAASLPDRQTATYAVLVGTVSEKYVDEQFPDAEKLPFDSINDAVLSLLTGKADYVVSAYTNCLNFVRANPDKLVVLPDELTSEGCAVAVNKSETELLAEIDRVLEQFRGDGTLDRVISNWIREDGSAYVREEIPVLADAPALQVAVSAEREPMCFVENGQITGLDAELIRRIAYELGMRVEFSDMKFSAIIPSVLSGKTPVAVSNVTATDERRESVNFSREYFFNPQTILTRTEFTAGETAAEAGYTQLSDLAGKRIGVKGGGLFDAYALAQWPDAQLAYYESSADLIMALREGKIDAYLEDQPVARQNARTVPGVTYIEEVLSTDRYGFAFQKNDAGSKLQTELNAFMANAEGGALLDTLDKIWYGDDETQKAIPPAETLPATNGVIRFASDMQSAPFDYVENGQPMGADVDLITRFCREMGYGLTIETVSFGALLPGVASGKYDVVAACISITEERAESVHFSDPTYIGGVVAVVKDTQGSGVSVETARIGAMTGTTCEALVLKQFPNADPYSFTATGDMMLALKSGKIDYCVMAEIDAINYKRGDAGYRIARNLTESGAYSIAAAKGNGALVERMDALLDQYEAEGVLAKLRENWIRPDGSAYVIDEVPAHTEGPELRVAFCSGLEPSCFVKDGAATGHDIELIRRLAYDMGYRVTLIDMDFSALVAALESGRADVAISGIAATAERAEKVDFTDSYYEDPLVLVGYESAAAAQDGFFAGLASSFRKNFLVESRWKLIASGVGITLLLSVCSGLVGLVIGFGFCLLRMSRLRALDRTVTVITRILQGTPMVVLLMILYYIVFNKTGLSGISVAIIAFGLNFGAYASEIMLSGINAVDGGQREAAAAMGFTPARTFVKIVFPQAARHFLPVLKGEYISLVKITSVVGYVAVQDLTKMSDIIRSRTYEAFFPLIVTAVIYFLLSYGLSSLLRLVEIRIDPKRRARTLKGVELS